MPVRVIAPRMGRTRSGSASTTTSSGAGPRMHDFKIQGGITQIRPGVLAHPTATPATVVPPGTSISPYADQRGTALKEVKEEEQFSLSISSPSKPQPMAVRSRGALFGSSYSGSYVENGFTAYREAGMPGSALSAVSYDSSALSSGWSLPRSDLRSGSVVSGDEDLEEIVSVSPGPEDNTGNGLDDDEVSSASKSGSVPASARFSRGGSAGAYGSYGTFGSYDSYGSRTSPDGHPEYEYSNSAFARRGGERGWKKDHEEENRQMAVREEEWEGMAVDMDVSSFSLNVSSGLAFLMSFSTLALNLSIISNHRCLRSMLPFFVWFSFSDMDLDSLLSASIAFDCNSSTTTLRPFSIARHFFAHSTAFPYQSSTYKRAFSIHCNPSVFDLSWLSFL